MGGRGQPWWQWEGVWLGQMDREEFTRQKAWVVSERVLLQLARWESGPES